MGYIKRQKKEEYIREQLNQKNPGELSHLYSPHLSPYGWSRYPPPYGKPMDWALMIQPGSIFLVGGRHLVGPWSPTWMFPHHSFTSKYMCPFSERTDWKYGEKKSSFSKYIGHTYTYIYPNVQGQNGMNSYPKKSTKNHLMGFFFIAFRWGKAARCILFLIQSNRWLCLKFSNVLSCGVLTFRKMAPKESAVVKRICKPKSNIHLEIIFLQIKKVIPEPQLLGVHLNLDYTPKRFTYGTETITQLKSGKSSEPTHPFFRFKLLIFQGVNSFLI